MITSESENKKDEEEKWNDDKTTVKFVMLMLRVMLSSCDNDLRRQVDGQTDTLFPSFVSCHFKRPTDMDINSNPTPDISSCHNKQTHTIGERQPWNGKMNVSQYSFLACGW